MGAWTFKASARHISISRRTAPVAWFDEALDTPNLGPARGSGVLVRIKGVWKVAHYDLSVPIPNGLLKEFKERHRGPGQVRLFALSVASRTASRAAAYSSGVCLITRVVFRSPARRG